MKKVFLFLSFAFALSLQAQEQFVQLMQDSAGNYRFQRMQVNTYTAFTDTLEVDRFPDRWLTPAELKSYQEALIAQQVERQNEIRRLFGIARQEVETQVAFYDAIQGEGAFLARQKEKMLESIQGKWQLIDRNGTNTTFEITITGNDFRRNAQRFGSFVITDDLAILLTGFFPFDATFESLQTGTFRAVRGQRVMVLKRL
jgi:hypothetical protein